MSGSIIGPPDWPLWSRVASLETEHLRHGFLLAYGTALVANLVSASLTYVYVPVHATELNPVVRWFMGTFGAGGMVVAKTAVVVMAYWGYALGTHVVEPTLTLPFAWLGALIHVLDALHDLRVAVLAGPVPPIDPATLVAVVVVAAASAAVLRPRMPALE